MQLDLGDLTFARGGALLVRRALSRCLPEETLVVTGHAAELAIDLRAWCRGEGHRLVSCDAGPPCRAVIAGGPAAQQRWQGAERAGGLDVIQAHPPRRWGLAARGALVEAGTPEFRFALDEKLPVWSDDAARLYAQAAAAQWDPATAVPWDAVFELPEEVEDAVVQVMTYLIENETAALVVPSRFLAQLHPHFKEVMQLLAIQAADEARHVEVFTRRALLRRSQLGLSTAGGQASLQTLVEEPDFAIATFLLSVLGEGTFLSLLWFLQHYAPDPVTAAVCRLAAQDESRHVAFGMSHLRSHLAGEPGLSAKLMNAVHKRHDALRHTAGLNAEVFDALVLMAAGSWDGEDLAFGYDAMDALLSDMHTQRVRRMLKLGFSEGEAEEMSALHTRNFM